MTKEVKNEGLRINTKGDYGHASVKYKEKDFYKGRNENDQLVTTKNFQ